MCKMYFAILETVVGGLFLTFILFILNEFVFRKANLTGEWKLEIIVVESSYNPYKNLVIVYNIHLLQKGYDLNGTGEKVEEIDKTGKSFVYDNNKRIVTRMDGFYERKFLRSSKVFLNVVEIGLERETRATYILEFEDRKNLKGAFTWTAANKKGSARLTRL